MCFVRLIVELGGGKESRTPDPLLARQVLYQLSYTPIYIIKTKQQSSRLKDLETSYMFRLSP